MPMEMMKHLIYNLSFSPKVYNMEANIKHRLIGSLLIISIAVMISPFFIKEEKPAWIVMEDNKSFKIPKPPEPITVSFLKDKTIDNSLIEEKEIKSDGIIKAQVSNAQLTFTTQQNHLIQLSERATLKQNKSYASLNALKKKGGMQKEIINESYYSVQLATFTKDSWARQLLDRLKKEGVDAYLRHIQTKSGLQYTLVMAGRLTDKNAVKLLQKKLDSTIHVNSLIVKRS